MKGYRIGKANLTVRSRATHAFHVLNAFTLADLKRPPSNTPRLDLTLMSALIGCMVAFCCYVVINNENAANIDTTTAVADEAPDNRIFTIAVNFPDQTNLTLFDYSSTECNESLSNILTGADPSIGGIGYFRHTSKIYQITGGLSTNDLGYTPIPLIAYLQPVPSPFQTVANHPNFLQLNDSRNPWGTDYSCYGWNDPLNPAPGNISYCYEGSPWLSPAAVGPTNYADGTWVNAFDLNGGRAPNQPYAQQPSIGGFRQCESEGNITYSDLTGAVHTQFNHIRTALVPMCYLSRIEQDASCISDPNGQIIDNTNNENRCRERGIFRFAVSMNTRRYALNRTTGLAPTQDQFGNSISPGFAFLDSQTLPILPAQLDFSGPASYYFTYQLTVVTDYTQPQPSIPTDLDTLCAYQKVGTDSTTQRDPATQNRILTLVSVERRPLAYVPNLQADIESTVYVNIGITPIWFHREIRSGKVGTLTIMAQLGGALTIVFTLLRVLREMLRFLIQVIPFTAGSCGQNIDDEESEPTLSKATVATRGTPPNQSGSVSLTNRSEPGHFGDDKEVEGFSAPAIKITPPDFPSAGPPSSLRSPSRGGTNAETSKITFHSDVPGENQSLSDSQPSGAYHLVPLSNSVPMATWPATGSETNTRIMG